MTRISFNELNLIEPILTSLKAAKYSTPTPIQAEAIPHLLGGGDLLGCAQTGTGKTAAFALPILQRLHLSKTRAKKHGTRALVLTPTRELAVQIHENFKAYGSQLKLRYSVIYGGVSQVPQVKKLSGGVDVIIATPGRLLDLMQQKKVVLDDVEIMVMDEADRMLDMGFIRDVKKIVAKIPADRQTLLFSATMPTEVASLADSLLKNPKKIHVNPVASTADLIDDHVLFVDRDQKRALLVEIFREHQVTSAIVFTRTKHRANRLAKELSEKKIPAVAIHGNKSQNARQKALNDFSAGEVKVLVATDIVSRGIDVDGISHVINFELPNEPESYVHRIGRTARAGTAGVAISFCDQEEIEQLADIEKFIKRKIEVLETHSHHNPKIAERFASQIERKGSAPRRKQPQRRGGNSRRRPSSSRGRSSAGRGNYSGRRSANA